MSGNFSDELENVVLNHVFKKSVYTALFISVGLCTADPTDEGTGANCHELPDAAGYARVLTTPAYWSHANEASIVSNIININFPTAIGGDWDEVTHFALFESNQYGVGGMLMYSELDEPKTVTVNLRFSFKIGVIKIKLSDE